MKTKITAPKITLNGIEQTCTFRNLLRPHTASESVRLLNGAFQDVFKGPLQDLPDVTFRLEIRTAETNPIVRWRYVLTSEMPVPISGKPEWMKLDLSPYPDLTEVRLGEFFELAHAYVPSEREVPQRFFEAGLTIPGPILTGTGSGKSLVTAFEHGCTVPDAFLAWKLSPNNQATLVTLKGATWTGMTIDKDQPFESPWFNLGKVEGGQKQAASAFRAHMLKFQSENLETRQPYIFYNTWNYQERNKAWYGKNYLTDMTEERMLKEIEVAARIGIDVFVIDTGWYEKTGDWQVSKQRFPNGLKPIKDLLTKHGMKLGLWFNPNAAALSSQMLKDHQDCLQTTDGQPDKPFEVWETEASRALCLVSRYWEAFADELIRLNKELGVTYFKWDAVSQYGCNDPNHEHGGKEASPEERRNAYAYLLPRYLTKVVDKLVKAVPEAIVDFDLTESGRIAGLQFLASGKLFAMNNGPYNMNYDFKPDVQPMGINLFVHPGPARGWICRQILAYDKWIPSILFLTHYLPDDPEESRMINLASLILGQNGIWGDLCAMSEEGITHFAEVLKKYKEVKHDITAADPVRSGSIGGDPEIHEKINAATGRGAIVAFSPSGGPSTWLPSADGPAAKLPAGRRGSILFRD